MLFPGPDLLAGTQRAGPGGVALRPGRRSVESLEPRGALFEAPGADGEVGGDARLRLRPKKGMGDGKLQGITDIVEF